MITKVGGNPWHMHHLWNRHFIPLGNRQVSPHGIPKVAPGGFPGILFPFKLIETASRDIAWPMLDRLDMIR